ncbi:MAG: TonB-dependent receptor, partial [Deltaproteobacteria bacterium]|nr:TonB-dependent receptor [Deltaproteobacteria bacterium]
IEDDIKLTKNISTVLGASYDIHDPGYANGGTLRDKEYAFNPQAGISWDAAENMTLHFSVGRKTRFPTLQELYSGLLGRNSPNPGLKEEKTVNYEVGIDKYLPGNTNIGFTLFYSDIDDLIVKKLVAPKTDQYQNIGEARYKGLEFSFKSGYFRRHNAELHYTFLEAEDRSPDRTSDHLEERPKHKLYVSDFYKIYDWLFFFAKLEWNSKRYYEDSDTSQWLTLSGFTTVDAKVIGKVTKFLNIEAGAKNIFDKEYEFTSGYPREGRTFFVQLHGEF